MSNIFKAISQFWVDYFLITPINIKAIRIAICALLSLLLFYIIGLEKEGLTVGMGLVAAALIDNEIEIKSAIRSTIKVSFLFFTFASLTLLVSPYPILFGLFIVLSTFLFTIIGGYGSRLSSLGFGSILIIIYTLIIQPSATDIYTIPSLFTVGVVIYMLSSMLVIWINPYRPLQNEISHGYKMLGNYLITKAKFFPSTAEEQESIRNELALINIELFSQTQKIKALLDNYYNSNISNKLLLSEYTMHWNKLLKLHERAVSSHEPYDMLTKDTKNPWLVQGFGKLLYELGDALHTYAISILKKSTYQNPMDLLWTNNALQLFVKKYTRPSQEYILYLYKNISSITSDIDSNEMDDTFISHNELSAIRLKNLFSFKNPKFRHAVRLSLCFLVGYIFIVTVSMPMGSWVLLTSLIVCQQTYNATRQRFFKRVIGTLLGVIISYLLVILVPSVLGQITILLISMYLFFKYLKTNYIIAAIFITVYVISIYNVQSGTGTDMMLPRMWATIIGSLIAFLSIRFLWPEWQYKNIQTSLLFAIESNRAYLKGIMSKDISEVNYLKNKSQAHQADIALTQGWKSMRIEPKSKRKLLTAARDFTYLNHTLLSYISAMGVHRKNLVFGDSDIEKLHTIISLLEQIKNRINSQDNPHPSLETINPIDIEKSNDSNIFLKNILDITVRMNESVDNLEF